MIQGYVLSPEMARRLQEEVRTYSKPQYGTTARPQNHRVEMLMLGNHDTDNNLYVGYVLRYNGASLNIAGTVWVYVLDAHPSNFMLGIQGGAYNGVPVFLTACCGGWSGNNFSGSGGGSGIITGCCPDIPMPSVLTVTITDLDGPSCIDGFSYEVTFTPGGIPEACAAVPTDGWVGTYTNPCDSSANSVVWYCNGEGFESCVYSGSDSFSSSATPISCLPFHAQGTGTFTNNSINYNVEINIT